jgi:hypothetical protein
MGMSGGPVYARACAEALPRLFAVISAPDSRSAENNTATENSVSAVSKIFKYNNSCIDNLDKVKEILFIKRKISFSFSLASSNLVFLASNL